MKRWMLLLPFLLYFRSLSAPFVFDDVPKIVNNPDIKSLRGILPKLLVPGSGASSPFNRNDPSRPVRT